MKWAEDTKSAAKALYLSGKSSREVAEALVVPEATIQHWIRLAGIARDPHAALREALKKGGGRASGMEMADRIRLLYEQGLSSGQVGEIVGLHKVTVGKIAKRFGFGRTRAEAMQLVAERIGNSLRKYTLNAYAFDVLSPSSAWALGVVVGDGCIVRNVPTGRLNGLNVVNDRDVCEKVAAVLGSDAPVTKHGKTKAWSVTFNSPVLAANLAKYGVVPAKSNSIVWPEMSETLWPHFLRGFLDADGCVLKVNRKYLGISFSTNSATFIEVIRRILAKVTGTRAKPSKDKKGNYRLGVSCGNARKLAEWLWRDSDDSTRGTRKYERQLTILAEEARLPGTGVAGRSRPNRAGVRWGYARSTRTPSELLALCDTWDGSLVQLALVLRETCDVMGLYGCDLAAEFGVSDKSISRWTQGVSGPPKKMQPRIIKLLANRLRAVVDTNPT